MKRRRDRGDQPVDVGGDGIGQRGLLEVVLAPPGDRLVEKGEIAGRLHVVAQRLQRPDDDVAVRLAVLNGAVGLEHEPLRPVAALLVLLGEKDAQNRLGRRVVLQRQQQLHRALADVAHAPGGAGVLLEAVRRRQMHHGVVRQPRQDRVDRRGVGVGSPAGDPDAARDGAPGAIRARQHRHVVDAAGVFRRQRLGALRIGHRADHGESERVRRARAQGDEGAAAALAVGVKQLVAADGLDALGRARDEAKDRLRIVAPPLVHGIGPEGELLFPRVDRHPPGVLEFALAEGETAENEEAARLAVNADAPLHRGLVARNDRGDDDGSVGERIDPAAIAEADLERGRNAQQPPPTPCVHEHAQPAVADDVVGIARDGEELVKRRVADGELRAEHAVHPSGGAQGRFVGQHRLAAAQQGAVTAHDEALLVAQDDMAAMGLPGDEEGQKPAVDPLDVRAPDVARLERRLVEGLGDEARRVLHEAARRGGRSDLSRRPRLAGAFDVVDQRKVVVARRGGMVDLVKAEKRPGRRGARRQRSGLRLKSGAGGLALQALRGEVRPERPVGSIGVAPGWAHELAEIGGEAGRAFEAAMGDPGMRAVLGQVLPAHQDVAHAAMARDAVIEILAGIGFVARQEARLAEAEILDEDGVAAQRRNARVDDLDPP